MNSNEHLVAAACTAEHELINALMVDERIALHAHQIKPSDFTDMGLREIWIAAQRAVKSNKEADPATLIELGAPQSLVVALVARSTTSFGWKQAAANLLQERRRKEVVRTIARANDALKAGNVDLAMETFAEQATSVADNGGLGESVSAKALCDKPPITPPEIIHGVLYGRGTMMLSGPSKSRKTYTFVDLGLSVASGMPWLGFPTHRTPVIYLNLELAEHSFERRLSAIAAAKGIPVPDSMHILNLRGKLTTLAKLRAELPRKIARLGAGLVILDPWYKISATSGAEENSNDGQARILAEIESICNEAGASVVVGHHFAKGNAAGKNAIDRAAGAGAMARWGDVIATLSELKEEDTMVLEMVLRDFPKVEPVGLRWNQPIWLRDAGLNTTELKAKPGPAEKCNSLALVELLPEANKEGITSGEWERLAEEKLGIKRSAFYTKKSGAELSGLLQMHPVTRRFTRK